MATISVAYHPNMHGGALVQVAEKQGYFAAEGLKVNLVRFTSGAPEINAMIAGQLDIGYLGPGALPAVMRGEVELITLNHANANERLIASQASGVTTPATLKGKSVLFASGTTGEFVLRAALKSAGLTMSDVTPINSPDESSTTAYLSNSADVISVGPTFTAQAMDKRPSVVVYKTLDDPNFALPGFWIANRKFVQENRPLVDRFLRAFGRANDYRVANLAKILPEVQAFTQVPEADLRKQIELTKWWTTAEINAAIKDGRVDAILRQLNAMFQDTGKMDRLADPSSYFNKAATLAAYDGAGGSTAGRVGGDAFPWLGVALSVLAALVISGVIFVVRRARS